MRIVIVFLLEDIVKNKIFKTFNIFSIQSLKVKVKVTHSCLTLCDPIDYTVHGNLQARRLEWVAFPFSRGIFPTRGLFQANCLPAERVLYQLRKSLLPVLAERLGLTYILQADFYQLSHKGSPRILEWVIIIKDC